MDWTAKLSSSASNLNPYCPTRKTSNSSPWPPIPGAYVMTKYNIKKTDTFDFSDAMQNALQDITLPLAFRHAVC